MADEAQGGDFRLALRAYLKEMLEHDREVRAAFPYRAIYTNALTPIDPFEDPLVADEEAIRGLLSEAGEALARRDIASVKPTTDSLMLRFGVPLSQRNKLALGVLAANVKALQQALKRHAGDTLDDWFEEEAPPPPAKQQVSPPPPPPQAPTKPLVSSLLESHFARRIALDGMLKHDVMQERTTLRYFMEVCGDRPVDSYQRGDVTAFLDVLRKVPPTYGRSPKDRERPLAQVIADAEAAGSAGLTERTVKRHLSALAQFFRYGMDQGHIGNAERVGLVEDHRFGKPAKGAKDQRDLWTPEELTILFRSPVWTGRHPQFPSKPGPHIIKDAKYWLPLLALFQGTRLEEFAGMRRKDIGCQDGIWFASISDEERRLKTDNSRRVIPLHSEILRLGFVDYVEEKAPNPDDPLFPDLEPQPPDQKRGPRFTRDFGYYRRRIKVYREGVGMHAFRHTANTRLRDAITNWQQERHVAYLLGHSQGGGEGRERYDKGPGLRAVAQTLALLKYPEVEL
jgi:integrase